MTRFNPGQRVMFALAFESGTRVRIKRGMMGFVVPGPILLVRPDNYGNIEAAIQVPSDDYVEYIPTFPFDFEISDGGGI